MALMMKASGVAPWVAPAAQEGAQGAADDAGEAAEHIGVTVISALEQDGDFFYVIDL